MTPTVGAIIRLRSGEALLVDRVSGDTVWARRQWRTITPPPPEPFPVDEIAEIIKVKEQ
jgi:hypothetical protein